MRSVMIICPEIVTLELFRKSFHSGYEIQEIPRYRQLTILDLNDKSLHVFISEEDGNDYESDDVMRIKQYIANPRYYSFTYSSYGMLVSLLAKINTPVNTILVDDTHWHLCWLEEFNAKTNTPEMIRTLGDTDQIRALEATEGP